MKKILLNYTVCALLLCVSAMAQSQTPHAKAFHHAIEHIKALPKAPAGFKCSSCGWQGELKDFTLACPECKGPDLDIISGPCME